VANALIEEFQEAISVARVAPGSYVNGTWVDGSTSTLSLQAVVMPLDGTEILAMDLGEHATSVIKVYCETALQTANEVTHDRPDIITWQGDQYQVHSVAYRAQAPVLEHYDVLAIRREGT